ISFLVLEVVLVDKLEEAEAGVFELCPRRLRLLAAVQLGMRDRRGQLLVDRLDLGQLARMLLVPQSLDVFPRDLWVLLAELADLGAAPLALLVLALAIELALDDVVIDQVLDELAQLDVV